MPESFAQQLAILLRPDGSAEASRELRNHRRRRVETNGRLMASVAAIDRSGSACPAWQKALGDGCSVIGPLADLSNLRPCSADRQATGDVPFAAVRRNVPFWGTLADLRRLYD